MQRVDSVRFLEFLPLCRQETAAANRDWRQHARDNSTISPVWWCSISVLFFFLFVRQIIVSLWFTNWKCRPLQVPTSSRWSPSPRRTLRSSVCRTASIISASGTSPAWARTPCSTSTRTSPKTRPSGATTTALVLLYSWNCPLEGTLRNDNSIVKKKSYGSALRSLNKKRKKKN